MPCSCRSPSGQGLPSGTCSGGTKLMSMRGLCRPGASPGPISRPESSRPSCRRTAVPDLRPGKYCTHPLTSVPDFRRIRKIVPACRCPIDCWPSSLQGEQTGQSPGGDKVPHRRHKSKNLVSLTQAKTFMPHSECFAKTLGPAQMRCVAAVQPPEKQGGSLPAI